MSVTFQSIRFGTVEVPDEDAIEFPFGLVGLGGLRYALLDRNPGSGFLWLHSLEEPALALPVVSPHQFFSEFALEMAPEDRERTGIDERRGSDPLRDGASNAQPARHHRQPARAARDPGGPRLSGHQRQPRAPGCRRRCSPSQTSRRKWLHNPLGC